MIHVIEIDTERRTARFLSGPAKAGKLGSVVVRAKGKSGSKLTPQKRKELRADIKKGKLHIPEIAAKYGVSVPYIYIVRVAMKRDGIEVPDDKRPGRAWRKSNSEMFGGSQRASADDFPEDPLELPAEEEY